MSKAAGDAAESAAAAYLKRLGYKVVERNHKTVTYEIDIIAKHQKALYFIEVKYRSSSRQGAGLDYVTTKKLQQMTFAADAWVAQNGWPGDYCLGAIEVSGPEYEITEFIPTIVY